jgi:hypothetical protein
LVVAASVALLLLAYVTDGLLAGALRELRLNHSGSARFLAVDAAARLLGAACLLGLGWLVVIGPRQRAAGAVLLVIGTYVAVGLVLWAVGAASIAVFAGAKYPTDLTMWMGSGIAILGLVELVWPSKAPSA